MKVSLVGAGNVAWHLGHLLYHRGYRIVQIASLRQASGERLAHLLRARWVPAHQAIFEEEDLVLVCVPDKVLFSQWRLTTASDVVVAHTAAAVPVQRAGSAYRRNAVFYPFSSFTYGQPLKRSDFPIFIEAEHHPDAVMLHRVAQQLTGKSHASDADQRLRIHLAGVFANNFVNYLLKIAFDLVSPFEYTTDILGPILEETIHKALSIGPENAQTGPALRGDLNTLQLHQRMLEATPQWKELYQLISDLIQRQKSIDT